MIKILIRRIPKKTDIKMKNDFISKTNIAIIEKYTQYSSISIYSAKEALNLLNRIDL